MNENERRKGLPACAGESESNVNVYKSRHFLNRNNSYIYIWIYFSWINEFRVGNIMKRIRYIEE